MTPGGSTTQRPDTVNMARAGDIVYIARSKAGVSQSELARRSGMTQAAISAIERHRNRPSFETLEWLVAQCGMYLAIRLEVNLAPRLPEAPWAKGIDENRTRIVNAVAQHGFSDPAVAPSIENMASAVLLVSALGRKRQELGTLQRELYQRLNLHLEVVQREALSPEQQAIFAKVSIPLQARPPGANHRETRFREPHDAGDDRWYGSVIDGVDDQQLRGSLSVWRWVRPPGSRSRLTARHSHDP